MLYLSYSSISEYQACPARYQYSHVLCRVPVKESDTLTFGRALHTALDKWWAHGREYAIAHLAEHSEPIDEQDAARLAAMLAHYNPPTNMFTDIVSEQSFSEATGLRGVRLVGRVDATAIRDGEIWLVEHKHTVSEIIGYGDYWQRLAIDHQIAWYCWAVGARHVLYDVLRKPGLRYCAKDASIDAYQARLEAAIAEAPEEYYQARDLSIDDYRIDAAVDSLKCIARQIRSAHRTGQFPRATGACLGRYGLCRYLDVCTGAASIDDDTMFRNKDLAP